jgi:signal transduction histidine kinase
MPPRQWLKPPRALLLALFALTLVAVSALAWFGRSLLEQERAVENQRAEERQEQAADRIATKLREALAETGERLGYWILNPPAEVKPANGVLLISDGSGLTATPRNALLYSPTPALDSAGDDRFAQTFAEGENLEFQQARLARALDWYKALADSKDPGVRAGALLRAARVSRKLSRSAEARAAYGRLAAIPEIRVAGAPSELIARISLSELAADHEGAERLERDLLQGRWSLSRGQFAFYWSEASRIAGRNLPLPEEAAALSAAAAQAWSDLARDETPGGARAVWAGGAPWLEIWSGKPSHRAVLISRPESVFRAALLQEDVSCGLADAEGRVLLGRKSDLARATVRTPAEAHLPWTLYIRAASTGSEAGMIARQRFLMLITGLMVMFLIAGAYFIARAIRTEAAMSRMQSDFVSAVSHEFRSPLTSMRQLSEILAAGRVSSEQRRQIYYETLVRETVRLQRLVEGLLNFGRMEAGARRFRFEETDAAELVESVAAEFRPQAAPAGRRIEVTRTGGACSVDADPEALTVALRNLVDNALKYAPDSPVVWLECGVERERVAIRVRDEGPGIPASERKAIFRRFVRGSAAASANVKGSGVGLATVRHIVTVHGGKIDLASEMGAGSTFTILLPRGASGA